MRSEPFRLRGSEKAQHPSRGFFGSLVNFVNNGLQGMEVTANLEDVSLFRTVMLNTRNQTHPLPPHVDDECASKHITNTEEMDFFIPVQLLGRLGS